VIKYVVGLLLGIALGVVAAGALLYFNPLAARNPLSNPLAARNPLSPLSVSNNRILSLGYSVVPTDSIVLTNNGESRVQPHPENVRELWEAPVRLTEVLVTVLTDLFVEQTENYWNFLRKIVLPAYWSSSNHWKGVWNGNMTVGPGALGTAAVTGGTGEFTGLESEAVEAVHASAYSVAQGPVSMEGRLAIDVSGNVELTASDVAER
jgi:hypothetical protein